MEFVLLIPILILSIVVHELAHAWQARREGDTTAEELGRITLNPLAHLDLWGSLLIPAMMWASAGVMLGWAKPVPVDPRRFREHPWSDIRVSLAGIVSNIGLAVGFVLLALVASFTAPLLGGTAEGVLLLVATYGIFINVLLAFFNLLPIPPLDGSHVVANLLPARLAAPYRRFGQFGLLAMMAVLILWPSAFSTVLAPVTWLVEATLRLVGAVT
jgi:Zn-dependent protease